MQARELLREFAQVKKFLAIVGEKLGVHRGVKA
jgi:hypothetical protein